MYHLLPHGLRRSISTPPFQVFGVGTAKSGTHSLWRVLSRYSARHEAYNGGVRRLIEERAHGASVDQELVSIFAEHQRTHRYAAYVSHLQSLASLQILEAVPHAKFILMIRDPYTWLDSMVNHQSANAQQGGGEGFLPYWRALLGDPAPGDEDKALHVEERWFSLAAYLKHWTLVNQTVLGAVPADRLLVIRTPELAHRLFDIADFLGVPSNHLRGKQTHDFTARIRENRLRQLDPDFLDQQIREYCGILLDRFYPEIRTIRDTQLWA